MAAVDKKMLPPKLIVSASHKVKKFCRKACLAIKTVPE
jgi:hypothetical protein